MFSPGGREGGRNEGGQAGRSTATIIYTPVAPGSGTKQLYYNYYCYPTAVGTVAWCALAGRCVGLESPEAVQAVRTAGVHPWEEAEGAALCCALLAVVGLTIVYKLSNNY